MDLTYPVARVQRFILESKVNYCPLYHTYFAIEFSFKVLTYNSQSRSASIKKIHVDGRTITNSFCKPRR